MPDRQLPPALCALSALAAASLVLWPADASLAASPQPAVEPERLDQVVVSASLRQQLERDAPATVTVITRRDIQGRPETDVASLLKSVGGVAVVGAGANDLDISLRGMPGDYTLLLVDGRRVSTRETMNRGTGGVQSHFLPPLSAIERIEVVRGPMSSLYGSEAMGGVVNIITRKRASQWSGALRAGVEESRHDEIGPRQALSAWAGGPVADGRVQLQLWASGLAKGEDDFFAPANGTSGSMGQHDQQQAVVAHVHLDDQQDLRLDLGRQALRQSATPGLSLADNAPASAITTIRHDRETWGLQHGGAWSWGQTELSLTGERARQRQWSGPATTGIEPALSQHQLEARALWPWAGGQHLTAGWLWQRAQLDGVARQDAVPAGLPANPALLARRSHALYAENETVTAGLWRLTLGARLDDDAQYGRHLSPRAYLVAPVAPGWTFKGGWATGFKAPMLRQSTPGYCMTTGGAAGAKAGTLCGNPDLQPETSRTLEAGLHWQSGASALSVTAFANRFRNRVVSFDTGRPDPRVPQRNVYVYDNLATVRLAGLELEGRTRLTSSLSMEGHYTFTQSRREGGLETSFAGLPLDGEPLDKTPRHQAHVRLNWTVSDAWQAQAAVTHAGAQRWAAFRNGAVGVRTRPATTTLDASVRWAFERRWALQLSVANLTDCRVPVDLRGRLAGLDGNWLLDEGRRLGATVTAEF